MLLLTTYSLFTHGVSVMQFLLHIATVRPSYLRFFKVIWSPLLKFVIYSIIRCQLKKLLVLVLNYSCIFMICIIDFLLLILKLNTKVWNAITFISMTLPCHWERSDICTNSCITNVPVIGVKLLNPRNISYSKWRIFCKQTLLCEFREFLVISWNSVANCSFLVFYVFSFFQEKLFAKVYVNSFCPKINNRNDTFKIGLSLPHTDYPH